MTRSTSRATTCDDGQFFSSSQSSFSSSTSSSSSCSLNCDNCSEERLNTHPNKDSMNRRTRSVTGQTFPWRCFKSVLLLVVLLATLTCPCRGSLEISAFEYQRKFHKSLELGECPQREMTVDLGNNNTVIEAQRCMLRQSGTVTHMPRELNDSRNVLITTPEAIVAFLGLCGGEAASFFGILNSGDCVAVEIASELIFSEKTVIRLFVGYHRTSLDILDNTNNILEGMDLYYKEKFYLKNRSYGTMEITFVQFRFRSRQQTEEATKIELSSPVMSGYMKEIKRRVGEPKQTTVISLSTASQETFETKRFQHQDWERAVRYVEVLELNTQITLQKILTNATRPHLKYQLFPFIDENNSSYRINNPIPWENISMLEVQLRQAITLAKKTSRKCRGDKTKLCHRVRELRRKLMSVQREIHKGRSSWVNLSPEEKNSFATRYTARVKSYSNVTTSMAKSVREVKKREKMEVLLSKNKWNQIPLQTNVRVVRKGHRVRHSKRRNKVRND